MSSTTAMKDPVCGMEIDSSDATAHTEHAGQTYYFCCSGCKAKFDKNPAQYENNHPGKPNDGGCCCS
jgi:Cu+-exporting ATPase